MALRIHFTGEDLARTRIIPTFGPLAETMWALSMLRCPGPQPVLFGGWREQVSQPLTHAIRPLAAMIPRGSLGVDLSTPTGAAATIEQGIEALRTVPLDRLRTEMEFFDRWRKLPDAAWKMTRDGDPRRELAAAAAAAYEALVEPYWKRIRAHLEAEQAARGRILMHGGVEQLLATLQGPQVRWNPPVLELPARDDGDLHLRGRGIVLVPSMFFGPVPALLCDPDEDAAAVPTLVFAAARDPGSCLHLWSGTRAPRSALNALVGRTRAAALTSVADGCTTTELARRVGVSLAAASQHATVLRDAGLITTRRQGSAVRHALTSLGAELLAVS
jgi:DNA-binding transcriptional ArsR family regulator